MIGGTPAFAHTSIPSIVMEAYSYSGGQDKIDLNTDRQVMTALSKLFPGIGQGIAGSIDTTSSVSARNDLVSRTDNHGGGQVYDQSTRFVRWESGNISPDVHGRPGFLQLSALAFDQVTIPLPQSEASQSADTIVSQPLEEMPSSDQDVGDVQSSPPTTAPSDQTTIPLPGADTPPSNEQETVEPSEPPAAPPVDINPYDRDIELTVPLFFRERSLGEVPITLTRDDKFIVQSAEFIQLVNPLLSEEARELIGNQLLGKESFVSDDLGDIGISLEYDPSSLSVVVLKIDPNNRAIENLFDTPANEDEPADIEPANFSALLNIDVSQSHIWGEGLRKPSVFLSGATRFGSIVAEADVEFSEDGFDGDGGYQFERNFVRLTYDQPAEFRRWEAGDLRPEVRGQQSFVQLGGVGVTRQRQRFNQIRSSVLQGNRRIVLQRDSTVTVLRNGSPYRELQLEAGAYDLSSLPLLSGSNDVDIQIRDNTGRLENVSYRAYLDPIDLDPGDYEYSAYIGALAEGFGGTPDYGDEIAFTGFFRKAFLDRPSIGIGVQASTKTQVLTGQTQFVLGNGARLQLDGGVSHGTDAGMGYVLGTSYQQTFDRSGLIDSFTVRLDHTSRRFAALGTRDPNNIVSFNIGASYNRAINRKLTMLFDASYLLNRDNNPDRYRIGAQASYRFSREWSVRGGVEYTDFGDRFRQRNGVGFNISLVFQPNYRSRAEARHVSNTDTSTLSFTRSGSNRLGSVGYGGLLTRTPGSVSGQGFADYTANRFDASINHTSFGDDFDSISDEQLTNFRVGTSLVIADGSFGMGRRVNDSFAVLYAHKNLDNRRVVAGQSIAENEFLAKSGPLGGAVNGLLTSYVSQSVQYDIENPPLGYDVGPGTIRVNPPYRSGYKIRVGTDAFVSATGTLIAPDKKPVSYGTGIIEALDGEDEKPLDFFTNSVGRFAVMNLRPGVRYRITLSKTSQSFEFVVPSDTTGLVNLEEVSLSQQTGAE